jgi:prepilin-type N-terminal cleavage/methylation domain-containing protein
MLQAMRNQRGFTLIEIVMVIVLLGIIAAIAIPRYIDMRTEARNATADGVVGAIVAAAAIGYADSAVKGSAAVTYPNYTSLVSTYLDVKNVTLTTDPANSKWTGTIGGNLYTFTYTQSNGSAGR